MLINPNKTMERKKYALSTIFNKHTIDKSARFLMALVTRNKRFFLNSSCLFKLDQISYEMRKFREKIQLIFK